MPLSIVGGKGGSFRKINLDISQTIESIQLICKSLNRSEENWWVAPDALRSINETKKLKMKNRSVFPESDGFPTDGQVSKDEDPIENDDDDMIDLQNDDEMIDLQADEEEESCACFHFGCPQKRVRLFEHEAADLAEFLEREERWARASARFERFDEGENTVGRPHA